MTIIFQVIYYHMIFVLFLFFIVKLILNYLRLQKVSQPMNDLIFGVINILNQE